MIIDFKHLEPYNKTLVEYRTFDDGFQVHDHCLHHVCFCDTEDMAKLIVNCINESWKKRHCSYDFSN